MDDAPIDMLMFSVNPAYDYGHGEYANGGVDERNAIYRRCEKEGVGISVMKPFSGGQLLDAAQSPFGQALTSYQCIRYSLDKPGVLTVLPGAQSVREVEVLLAYCDQLGGGSGLFRHSLLRAACRQRQVRLLQSLQALPCGYRHRAGKQIL